MLSRSLFLAVLVAAPAVAQTGVPAAIKGDAPPQRTRNVTVFGADKCPKAEADEIVVCSAQPESERYRIPKPLRKDGIKPANQSWVRRAETLDEVGRTAGLPGSCSTIGSNGQTGCTQKMLQQWYAARKEQKAAGAATP